MNNSWRQASRRLKPVGLPVILALVAGLVSVAGGAQVGPSRAEQAQAWLEYGVEQAKQGDYQSAIEALQRAIKIDPTRQPAYYNLGLVLYQSGQPAKAAHYFQEALKLTPTDRQAQRGLGLAYIGQGKYARAAEVFQDLRQVTADDPIVNLQLGRCYLALGKAPQAIPLLRQAVKLQPEQPEAHLYLGQALAATNKVVDAEDSLSRALRLRPDWEAAELMLLQLYVEAGRFLSAQPLVQKLLSKHPQDRDLLLAQVKIYDGLGLGQEKRQAQEALLAVLPADEAAAARRQLVGEYLAAGRYQQALEQLTKVRSQRPHDPDIVGAIAQCYIKLDQPQRAIQVLEQATQQGLATPAMFVVLGDAYARQKQYENALSAYDRALALDRDWLPALEEAVWVSGTLDRPWATAKYLRRILAIVPSDAESRLRLADHLVLTDEWGEAMQQYVWVATEAEDDQLAEESLSKLISLAALMGNSSYEVNLRRQRQQLVPDHADTRLAQIVGQQGDMAEAEQQARQMLQKHPDDPDVKATLAALLMASGQKPQAESLLVEVLAAKPLHGQANYLQARIHWEQDEPAAAIPFLKRAILARPDRAQPYEALLNCAEVSGQLSAATDFLSSVLADAMSADGARERSLEIVLKYLAEGYQRQGGAEQAARELAALSDAYPQEPLLAVGAARTLLAADQITEAVKYYSRAAQSPKYAGALVEATELLVDRSPAAALSMATRYLARVAGDGQAVALVAELLGPRHSVKAAQKQALQRLLYAPPGSVQYQFAKIDIAELLGQLPQLGARLAAQTAEQPQDTTGVIALAYALGRQGRLTEALTRLDMLPASDNTDVKILRATLLDGLSQPEQALEVVSEALHAAPTHRQACLLRAKLLVETGADQDALWEYCQLLARQPTMAPAAKGVAEIIKQGRLELSIILTALGQVYEVCPQPGAIRELVASLGDQQVVHKWLAAHPQVTGQRPELE